MENEVKLAAGAMVSLAVATAALVVLPYMEVRDITPPEGLKPYTSAQQALEDAFRELGAGAGVLAIPCGGSILPAAEKEN